MNSGLPQGEKEISFGDFQKIVLRVGSLKDGQVQIGRPVKVKYPEKAILADKVALFLPNNEAQEGLPLFTINGVAITVDGGDIEDGAQIR